MLDKHTVKAYDQELGDLRGKILGIGDMSRLQFESVLDSFKTRDLSKARQIIARDASIDQLELEINQLTVHMLAARQALAGDLRTIISALKIATDMERVADYIVNIARQLLLLNGTPITQSVNQSIITMMTTVKQMLKDILDAYSDTDFQKAMKVRERDAELDALYAGLLEKLRACMIDAPEQAVNACTALLLIGRCLERMGDHIKNVAEDIYFIVNGELFRDEV